MPQTGPMIEPDWMSPFLASLESDHLASATARGYRYDLRHFLGWYGARHDGPFVLGMLTEQVLIAYRRYMVAADQRPATCGCGTPSTSPGSSINCGPPATK
jgi:hypothetical protein